MNMRENTPWGFYRILEETDTYKVKYMYIAAGQRISLQKHKERFEHWVITYGKPYVTVGDFNFVMRRGDSISIEKDQIHRIAAPEDDYVEMIEIQTGTYFGEDDIIRIEDDYGR